LATFPTWRRLLSGW